VAGVAAGLQVAAQTLEPQHPSALLQAPIAAVIDHKPALKDNAGQSIPRKDQRRWGQTYLRGLLLDGKRKSIEPMAKRLARGDPAADAYALEQALQQFVSQSPWDPVPVRRRLAQRMTAAI
jgi:hypothetical protein